MGIVIAIVIFGLIVTVHEFGHFICAKLSGIKVLEFSVGMGPKLLQKQKGETKYSLRALPLGGYCAMEGEDAANSDPRSFRNAKLWKRMVVLAAGPFMNFVLGFIAIIIFVCMMDGVPTITIDKFGMNVADDGTVTYYSESHECGLRENDKLISIDGIRIYSMMDINYIFPEAAAKKPHKVVVKRDGERIKFDDVYFCVGDETTERRDFILIYKDKNPLTVVKGSGDFFMSMTHIIGLSLKKMVTGNIEKEEISGPVGAVSAISNTAKQSENISEAIFNLLYMMALISINVGIFNLLPIPGLDGGRLLFCLIELVRRKPIKPEHEGYVHLAGMVLLFGIMIFATYNDIVGLFTGGKNG